MKYLILSLLACLFLMTACFEKDEIEKEEEIEVAPPEVDILECEIVQQGISYFKSQPPREPRASVKKHLKGYEYIFETNTGGGGDFFAVTYRNSDCRVICGFATGITGGTPCPEGFLDSLVYVETVWIDER